MTTRPMNEEVTLRVGGRRHEGWRELEIRRSVEEAAASFSLRVSRRNRPPVPPDAPCEVLVGGDPLVTGFVTRVSGGYGPDGVGWTVEGRSRTADLVDCAPVGATGQFRNLRLEEIATRLAAPYGVTVDARVRTDRVADFQFQQGERIFDALRRQAAISGVLLSDDPRGRLVVARAGTEHSATALVTGENIVAADWSFDAEQRYSEIVVKGQQAGADGVSAEAAAGPSGRAIDPDARAPRTLVVIAQGQASHARCAEIAAWEIGDRAARAVEGRVPLTGFRQEDGALWRPNRLVAVRDSEAGVERDLLIRAVAFRLSGDFEGPVTELELVPAEVYQPRPAVAEATLGTGAWAEISDGV